VIHALPQSLGVRAMLDTSRPVDVAGHLAERAIRLHHHARLAAGHVAAPGTRTAASPHGGALQAHDGLGLFAVADVLGTHARVHGGTPGQIPDSISVQRTMAPPVAAVI